MPDFAAQILDHIHKPYPYAPRHILDEGESIETPASVSPVFCGSFDWHSSVHSHWALARLAGEENDERCREALATSFEPAKIERELDALDRPHRRGFELPYGMSWLLLLAAEIHSVPGWAAALDPLARLARARLISWLDRLPMPIRSGEHSQSAFAMGLVLDSARAVGDHHLERLVSEKARAFYQDDEQAPIDWEPSAYDFLSPALGEADLMSRVMAADEFDAWLAAFLPAINLEPVSSVDRSDGKFAHLDGLNLSRAWMLRRLAAVRPELAEVADAHERAGLEGLENSTYAGSHWLPSFAVYLKYGALD